MKLEKILLTLSLASAILVLAAEQVNLPWHTHATPFGQLSQLPHKAPLVLFGQFIESESE